MPTSQFISVNHWTLISTLAIKINKLFVTWHFTSVFWKRSIKIEDVTGCHVVKNVMFNASDIRILGKG
jgi:hypothetical protein